MTLLPLPALPPEVLGAVPARTPPAPEACRGEAVVGWHRAAPTGWDALRPEVRTGRPLTVGALVRYLGSPVGPEPEPRPCLTPGAPVRGGAPA